MQKTLLSVQHSATIKLNVVYFENTDEHAKGLAVFQNGVLKIKVYNPAEVTAWFQQNSLANVNKWRDAYHASGLNEKSFVRPARLNFAPSSSYTKLIPAPSPASVRGSLSPAKHGTMIRLLGKPGSLSQDCTGITNQKLLSRMVTKQITPNLKVYGFDLFVNLLQEIFDELKVTDPNLYSIVGTAGCVCCRAVRGSTRSFSNHSWGTAIDLKIGGILAPLNATMIPAGLVTIHQIARKKGLFWAQGYNGRTDPMHIEASQELLLQWEKEGKL